MKRSEMLKQLGLFLDSISCQEVSPEEILYAVEGLGMLPPLSNEDARTETEAIYEWDKE